MKAEDVAKWLEGIAIDPRGGFMRRADAIRSVIEERDALLEERQRFETRLFDMAEAGNQARAERDALRTLLAAARAHLLGDGHGYDSAVVVAIDVELELKP